VKRASKMISRLGRILLNVLIAIVLIPILYLWFFYVLFGPSSSFEKVPFLVKVGLSMQTKILNIFRLHVANKNVWFTLFSSDLYLQVQFLLWWLSSSCEFWWAAVAFETSAELTVVLRVTELSVLEEAIN